MPFFSRARELCLRHKAEIFLFAAAAALRLGLLGARSLGFDEAKTLVICARPAADIPAALRALEGTPPLYFLIVRLWLKLFADPRIGLRLFSALCGLGALAAFYRLCRQVLPGRERLPLLIGAFAPYWIHESAEGRAYALFLLLAVVQAGVLLDLRERWRGGALALYAACAAAGAWVHNYYWFLLSAHFLYGLLLAPWPPRRRALWAVLHAGVLAAWLPWVPSLLVQMARRDNALLASPFSLRQLGDLFGNLVFDVAFLGLLIERWTRALGWTALGLALGGFAWAAASRRPRAGWEGAVFCAFHLVVPLALVAAVEKAIGRPITEHRYFIGLSAPLYLLASWTALEVLPGASGRLAALGLAALEAAGAAAFCASVVYIDPGLARFSEAMLRAGDRRSVLVHANDYYYTPLRYYYLSELPHYLLCPEWKNLNWKGLSGYTATPGKPALSAMDRCVLVDPERRYSDHAFSRRACAELAGLVCPAEAR